MKKQLGVLSVVMLLVTALFALSALASDGQVYLSSDKNGQNKVTNVQEGDSVFIVVIDNDENRDCDIRDKFWTDVKLFDPKTGAYFDWISWGPVGAPVVGYVGRNGFTGKVAGVIGHYFEETGADTGVFVSNVSFQIGRRINWTPEQANTHWVGFDFDGLDNLGAAVARPAGWAVHDWEGDWDYLAGVLTDQDIAMPAGFRPFAASVEGRFENMDTLVVMYRDPNAPSDVAVGMAKIIDTEATISWDQEVYKDANGSATITVVDPDENLNCNAIEWVPVFVIVNPGSWNPIQTNGSTTFCSLKRNGGIAPAPASPAVAVAVPALGVAINWANIYNSGLQADTVAADVNLALATPAPNVAQPDDDGSYYIQYPNANTRAAGVSDGRGGLFDTATFNGETRVSFYAQETGVDTGVFEFSINQILLDLGFNTLNVRDVLVAYYLDPNDEDDFKVATAYIEERQHSITSFTDATRADKDIFWIGRDPVYVQVIDANANVDPCCPEEVVVHICDVHENDDVEWLILEETSSNSPVFFSNAGTVLDAVWNAMGVGINPGGPPETTGNTGGYQLQVDNWKLEVYNEDDVYARYNDVYYFSVESVAGANDGLAFLGDVNPATAFPPIIERIRVANDVSFDLMSIADTQVFADGQTQMYFLDRQGSRVSGYVNSDCVFVEVVDPDQDEDQYRRERIDAFWDGFQNGPFGPADYAANHAVCGVNQNVHHQVNQLLGDTNIFSGNGVAAPVAEVAGPAFYLRAASGERLQSTRAKLYVLNPRNGQWAPVDLLETGVATGDFVSVICIDLVQVYECAPSLGVLPGDTIVAVYQDPSNHSDSAWISIKVGVGGGGTPPTQQSTTMFVDADGNDVANYTDADQVYVKVIDPSHTGAALLANAVEIDGTTYDLTLVSSDTFMTAGLDLGVAAGSSITANYTDPTDPTDTSSDTITVIASVLEVIEFYAGPSPFDGECAFGYTGTGTASVMSVHVYDLNRVPVWSGELTDVTEIVWDGTDMTGASLANGAYIYTIYATDGTNTFTDSGKVFINR